MNGKNGFFGIGRIRPFLRNFRKELWGIALFSAFGSVIDIGVPLFQRYAICAVFLCLRPYTLE